MNRNNENQRRKSNLRRAANKKLYMLLIKHDYKCYWCGEPIIRLASGKVKRIPKDNIVEITRNHIIWFEDGKEIKMKLATVDHVVRIADGGDNKNNLVPSCSSCNYGREIKKWDFQSI